jgi:uncharacterized protein involved in type VI secretion and phage assembly
MTESIIDILQSGRGPSNRVFGVVTGVVTNNQDPDGLGRVRVRFPWLSSEDESWWARIAAPAAGAETGVYFLPDVDDEVLVVFEHGDVRFPYVLGCLWNGNAKPPESNDDGKNARRTIKTPAGHVIRLDDSEDGEKIEIVTAGGDNSIVIEKGGSKNTLTITAKSDVTVTSTDGTLKLAAKDIEVKADNGVKIEAGGSGELKASGQLTLKGSVVNIN